jgi:hypothetical protein
MTAVALLLALQMPSHVEAPPGDVGEVRRDFRGTKWVAVSGHKGRALVRRSLLHFQGNTVILYVWMEDGVSYVMERDYRIDPASGLPVLLPVEGAAIAYNKGKVRFGQQDGRLLLDVEDGALMTALSRAPGNLRLVLKQLK